MIKGGKVMPGKKGAGLRFGLAIDMPMPTSKRMPMPMRMHMPDPGRRFTPLRSLRCPVALAVFLRDDAKQELSLMV